MIVRYGDFHITRDDGHLALAYAPDPESKEVEILCYLTEGSFADVVAKIWTHQSAPPGVVEAVRNA